MHSNINIVGIGYASAPEKTVTLHALDQYAQESLFTVDTEVVSRCHWQEIVERI